MPCDTSPPVQKEEASQSNPIAWFALISHVLATGKVAEYKCTKATASTRLKRDHAMPLQATLLLPQGNKQPACVNLCHRKIQTIMTATHLNKDE